MLFAVADGYRDFDFVYGMTYISGNTITTGKIQSIDGNNYLDLTNNKFRVGDANSFFDWNVTTGSKLTIKGALAQSPAGDTAPLPVFRGAYAAGTTYYKGDQVTYGGSSWNYINATEGAGHTPAENTYWTKAAAAGTTGATGPAITYRGIFSAATAYNNNTLVRDVVNYSGTYYIYKGADGASGAWNAANWDSLGASFSSVATGLLLAELAYIDNLGVKYFNGIAVPVGDLAGSVVNTTANVLDVYDITLSGTIGTCRITFNGVERTATFNGSLTATVDDFLLAYSGDFPGSSLSKPSANVIRFTGATPSGASCLNLTGDLNGSPAHTQTGVKRVDTVTLTGTAGTANILCDAVTSLALWNDNGLADTAADFVSMYAASYLVGGVVVTSDEDDVIFTAQTAGVNFTGATTITNVPNTYRGSLKIQGNEIWENDQDDNLYGYVTINRKGYDGGKTRYRHFLVGNGRGQNLIICLGSDPYGYLYLNGDRIWIPNIPTSNAGLTAGQIYRDGAGADAALKIK